MQKIILSLALSLVILAIGMAITMLSYRSYQSSKIMVSYIPIAIDTGSVSSGAIAIMPVIPESTDMIQTGGTDGVSTSPVLTGSSTTGSSITGSLPIDLSLLDARTGSILPSLPIYTLCSPGADNQSPADKECQRVMRESMDQIERDQALWIHTGTWVQTDTGIVSTSSIQ